MNIFPNIVFAFVFIFRFLSSDSRIKRRQNSDHPLRRFRDSFVVVLSDSGGFGPVFVLDVLPFIGFEKTAATVTGPTSSGSLVIDDFRSHVGRDDDPSRFVVVVQRPLSSTSQRIVIPSADEIVDRRERRRIDRGNIIDI
jgi:hypothetical protein